MPPMPPMPPKPSLLRRAQRALVATANRLGWVVAPTSDYYHPLRPVGELMRHASRWHRPSAMAGIPVDLDAMERTLATLVAEHGAEYDALPPYDEIKRQRRGPGFTLVDARVLYLMLRHQKPRRYLEVGSGLSTYYASLALARNAAEGTPAEMTAIDPYVSEATRAIPGLRVVAEEAQAVPVERYTALAAGDVLFIDTTHIVRIDGEVPYLVLEVLPALPPGVLVHIHDVHLPFHVPIDADAYVGDRRWPMLFTEAMLVQAYLAHNARVELVLSTPLLRFHREAALRRLVPDYRPLDRVDFDTHHGSLWFRTR